MQTSFEDGVVGENQTHHEFGGLGSFGVPISGRNRLPFFPEKDKEFFVPLGAEQPGFGDSEDTEPQTLTEGRETGNHLLVQGSLLDDPTLAHLPLSHFELGFDQAEDRPPVFQKNQKMGQKFLDGDETRRQSGSGQLPRRSPPSSVADVLPFRLTTRGSTWSFHASWP